MPSPWLQPDQRPDDSLVEVRLRHRGAAADPRLGRGSPASVTLESLRHRGPPSRGHGRSASTLADCSKSKRDAGGGPGGAGLYRPVDSPLARLSRGCCLTAGRPAKDLPSPADRLGTQRLGRPAAEPIDLGSILVVLVRPDAFATCLS